MLRRLLVALGFLGALTACASGQDPGVPSAPASGGSVTTTTSHGLERCPAGGPDTTTAPAGCLDKDGTVVHRS